jgi:hypothetical protein
MRKKNQGTTGFRNGDLFCFNCGTAYNMNLPQPVTMASAMMIQFEIDHKDCLKTWTEPIADGNDGKSMIENMQWWRTHGEQGVSSKTMFKYIGGIDITGGRESHPHDPDDFKRCYKLLQAIPQFKQNLHLMKEVSPVWSKLVDNWDKLTEMYEQNVKEDWKNYKKIGMYEFMDSLGC